MAAIALMGAMVALAGGVWDDAWHTDRGRDSFLIAPHIALYAGVSLIGGALTLWLAREIRAGGLRRAVTVPGLRLGLLSVSATLASAPIDNAWHEAFGRDAVIWSPPHMLGIVGTLSLGVVLLDQLRDRTWPSAMAGGLLLTGAAFPVIEYETDVPQFAVLWYLPVLSAGLAVAFALIRRCAGSASWPLTRAAGVQLLLFGLLALFLAGQGFPAPAFPLLLAPALVADATLRRGWPAGGRAPAVVAALLVVAVPVRDLLGDGVRITVSDVALGAPLMLAAALLGERLVRPGGRERSGRVPALAGVVALALAAALAVSPPAARAHDPGQGPPAGVMALALTAEGLRLTVSGRRPGCTAIDAVVVTARRAGRALRAPMTTRGCRFGGALRVPERGRWFVYVDLREGGRPVQAWLPVQMGARSRVVADRRFAYRPDRRPAELLRYAGGATLYLLMAALLAATFRLAGRPGSGLRTGSAPAAEGL